jgi:hypothetical protein
MMDAHGASLSSSSMLVSFHLVSRSHRHLSCRSSSPSITEKGGKLALGASLLDGLKAPFILLQTSICQQKEQKGKKLDDEQDRERFFDLKTVVLISFFPMFFYANWGCNGRRKIEH